MSDFFLKASRFGLLDQVIGFQMVKEEGDKVFTIDLDSCHIPTVATSLGWRGEPGLEDDDAERFLLEKTEYGRCPMDFVGTVYMWEDLGGKEVEKAEFSNLLALILQEVLDENLPAQDFPDDMEVLSVEHKERDGKQLLLLHVVHDHTVTLEVKW